MKFFTLVALFAGVSAVRLESHSAALAHSHVQAHAFTLRPKVNMVELRSAAKTLVKTKLNMPELTEEQQLEIVEWIISELGGGTITKQEAHDALVAFLNKHGYDQPTPDEWEFLEAIFDHVDKNGDGEIDLKEFVMAMAGECGGPEQQAVQLKKNAKKFVQTKLKVALPEKLTPAQEKEIMDWVLEELGGGTITKDEAHDAIVDFCDKHGFPQPTPEMWAAMEEGFDAADANGDGEIDLKEFAYAMHA